MTDPQPQIGSEVELTDAAIDAVLAGRRPPTVVDDQTRQLVGRIALAFRPPVPDDVVAAVSARLDDAGSRARRWDVGLRAAAALTAGLFGFQGIPSLVASEYLADFLGLLHEPHIFQEVGILSLALAVGLFAAAFRPRLLSGVLAIAVPAGVGIGLFGLTELTHSPNPAAEMLHIAQALAAIALGTLWLLRRRRA